METQNAICVRIWGGLGNQMFQYAAGHAAASRLGVPLLVDPLDGDLAHAKFGLDCFGIAPEIWTPIRKGGLSGLLGGSAPKGKKRAKLWPGATFKPEHFCHADGFDDIAPGTYLNGYFQSEQFFAEEAEAIRALYSLDDVVPGIDAGLRALAARPESVSIHIRRGDYASNPKTTETHGILGTEHYRRAVAVMKRMVPDANWLVFSDDIAAAAEITDGLANRTLVEGQGREQDLCLMMRCSHHIIANSSFSWWGAWLGRNPDRTVIAPRQWFSKAEMRRVYVDELYPAGWILV